MNQSTTGVHAQRVEDLEKYGASLEMPKEAVKAQIGIMFKALRKEFGFLGMYRNLADSGVTMTSQGSLRSRKT
jgi:hypothetical protein